MTPREEADDGAAAGQVDVIVLGCGPAGLALAVLLVGAGLRVAAIDKHRLVLPYPRATHIDDETVRIFQMLGIAEETAPELTESGEFTVYDGDWRPFIEVRLPPGQHRSEPTEQGWKRDYMFQQPDFESRLRGRLVASPLATTWFGWDAEPPQEDAEGVEVTVRSRDGLGTRRLRGTWLVGADGARSAVREAMGVGLIDLNGTQRSLIVDIHPFRHNHVLAERTSFVYCAPGENPLTYVRTARPRARFEVMLRRRDAEAPFLDHRFHHRVPSRWFRPDEYRIERADLYRWRSVLAAEWRRGRVLLLGDAAHEMSPMLGQGVCSGLRDAANLAWKLVRVVHGQSPAGLLDTYGSERAPHVRRFIEVSAHIANSVEAWADDPPVAGADGARKDTIERFRPRLGPGLHDLSADPIGTLAPQPRLPDGRLMDDAVGYRFAVLAMPEALAEMDGSARAALDRLDARAVPAVGDGAAWLRARGEVAAVIRPDRYLHALAQRPSQLSVQLRKLQERLAGQVAPMAAA